MHLGERIEGVPRVIDGDSVELDGRELRLRGIDAPEFDQTCGPPASSTPCGQMARAKLQRLAQAGHFRCRLSGRDRYGRDLADCEAGTISVNAEMVRSGFAVAYGGYSREQAQVRLERKGIWAQEFVTPADWRKGQGRGEEPDHHPAGGFSGFLRRLLGV
ncbi:thermonuclease family protein [Pseudohoeflea suaedae]|nr:thermonuclease family protein [Pseudohoeflea suaedae]